MISRLTLASRDFFFTLLPILPYPKKGLNLNNTFKQIQNLKITKQNDHCSLLLNNYNDFFI